MNGLSAGFAGRERVVLLVLALYVTVALVMLTPIGGAIGDNRQAALPPPPTAAGGAAADRAAPPTDLAAGQRLRAGEIVAADRSLAAALGGTRYSIVKAGPWTTSGADGAPSRTLGAAFIIAPEKPVALRSERLPGALYDQTERTDPPYQRVTNTVSADQVTQMMVLVDLERGAVVNVTPGPDARGVEIEAPPGFERSVPVPREEGR